MALPAEYPYYANYWQTGAIFPLGGESKQTWPGFGQQGVSQCLHVFSLKI